MAQIAPNTLLVAGDMGHQVQNRLAGIWGRVVEVERNDSPGATLSNAILKTTGNRIMDDVSVNVRVEGIFDSNGYLIPAGDCEVRYYSESPHILKVDEVTGTVTALSEGVARVIASVSHDGENHPYKLDSRNGHEREHPAICYFHGGRLGAGRGAEDNLYPQSARRKREYAHLRRNLRLPKRQPPTSRS